MDNHFKFQTGKELLEKSIEQWTQEGFFNYDDNGTSFSNKKFDNSEEEAFIQNMENDPVVNLFMTALAHQTNLLKEQILSIQSSLLSEFVKLTSPYHLTRAIPAMSVMQICPSGGFDSSWADDSTVILLEKKSKTKMRFKELEKFSFLPLLKTKILNAKLKSVRKTAKNIFELEIAGESAIGNLSGMSLFLPRIQATNMQILVNDRPLPVISMNDFERIPLCDIFNVSHDVYNQSLLYGSTESWLDLTASLSNKLFYVGEYDGTISEKSVTLSVELTSKEDVDVTMDDFMLNCFPIVNVEKHKVSLAAEEPIKKLAIENGEEDADDSESNIAKMEKQKAFLNLLAPSDSSYDPEQIQLRHFGAERFHASLLVDQTRALINRYSSDYSSFMAFADIHFDDKISMLRKQLLDIANIIDEGQTVRSGVYVMLKKGEQEKYNSEPTRLEVSYLLTDGKRGNGITSGGNIILPPSLSAKESRILVTTFGGSDEERDPEIIKTTARYYNQTHERLITKQDIKSFCVKELQSCYHINKEDIKDVSVFPHFNHGAQETTIHIRLSGTRSQDMDDAVNRVEEELPQKMGLRSAGFCTFVVEVEFE